MQAKKRRLGVIIGLLVFVVFAAKYHKLLADGQADGQGKMAVMSETLLAHGKQEPYHLKYKILETDH